MGGRVDTEDGEDAPVDMPLSRKLRTWLRILIVDNAPLVVAGLLYAVGARILAARFGIEDERLPGLISLRDGWSGGSTMALFFLAGLIYMAVVVNPVRRRFRARQGDPRPVEFPTAWPVRLAGIVMVYMFLGLFMDSFVMFKRAIPFLIPFRWDPQFHALDKLVHLGVEPWKLTHAVLGWPSTTVALDWLYTIWLPLGALIVTFVAFSMQREWKARFFFSYIAVWFLMGTVMATAMSSAGPCFYGRLLGADPYADLMMRLRELDELVGLASLTLQDGLWQNYVTPSDSLVKGISAMPSVHIALCVIFWLAFKARNRFLGWVFGIYALLVFIATIHLGWHYAIDGYVAAVGAWGIWWGSGIAARAYLDRFGDRAPATVQ